MEVAERSTNDQTVVVKPRDLCHRAIDDVEELWDFEEMTSSTCCSDLGAFAACDPTARSELLSPGDYGAIRTTACAHAAVWRHSDSKDLLSNVVDTTGVSVVGRVVVTIIVIAGDAAATANLTRKTEDEPLHG